MVYLNERVQRIKCNNTEINIFIEEYKPFIAACVQRIIGRFVTYGKDDELSIGLMAFAEAINSYEQTKGAFLPFAQNIIKLRLIDYFRKESKHRNVVSLHTYNENEDIESDYSTNDAIEKHSNEVLNEYRRLELQELKKELQSWDISFLDLVKCSPKHTKTYKIYNEIADFVLSNSELVSHVKTKKYLPISEIEKTLNVPRKTIERARKYIILVLIIKTGDYNHIKNYIDGGKTK